MAHSIEAIGDTEATHAANDQRKPPRTRQDVLNAIRVVTTYTIMDVFSLAPEETLWVSHHVGQALEVFENSKVGRLCSPVVYELSTGDYSKRVSKTVAGQMPQTLTSVANKSVDLGDWAVVISNIASESFYERPLKLSTYNGKIMGILKELGVGDPRNPRPSNYFPNSIMYLRNS